MNCCNEASRMMDMTVDKLSFVYGDDQWVLEKNNPYIRAEEEIKCHCQELNLIWLCLSIVHLLTKPRTSLKCQ